MIKRLKAAVIAVISAAIVLAVTPMALGHHQQGHHTPPGQGKKSPGPCASGSQGWDIHDGHGTYGNWLPIAGGDLHFEMELLGPSCSDVVYTIFVLDGPRPDGTSGTEVLYQQSDSGDETKSRFVYDLHISNDLDGTICVYHTATTSDGSIVHDRAPDGGCLDPMGGGRNYN